MNIIQSGPDNARIVILGERPGGAELDKKLPLVGHVGWEFRKMCTEAGLDIKDAFSINVSHELFTGDGFLKATKAKELGIDKIDGMYPNPQVNRGRKILLAQLDKMKPNVIIALGNVALWAVTGKTGITKWRGSTLEGYNGIKVIPMSNPASVMYDGWLRWTMVRDLVKVNDEQLYPEITTTEDDFQIRPTFAQALSGIKALKGKYIAVDIEPSGGHIACVGLTAEPHTGICIPFTSLEKYAGYWTPEEEVQIILALRETLTDKATRCVFQRGTHDALFFAKDWGYVPNIVDDTEIMHHVIFPESRASLDYLASIYADNYQYWKLDNKRRWKDTEGEDAYWIYNLTDCSYTIEIARKLREVIKYYKLEEQYKDQLELVYPVLKMMMKGVKIDTVHKSYLSGHLLREMSERMGWITTALGHPLNPRSPKQMADLFYKDFAQKMIVGKTSKTRGPTTDDDALKLISQRQPLLKPLCTKISSIRSISVLKANFPDALLTRDKRITCSINLCGTKTFRFSTSQDAFGVGNNLQTVTKGTKDDAETQAGVDVILPNLRKMFIPDRDYILIDADLKQADAQVVAWDADDITLKQIFRENLDLHIENAKVIFNTTTITDSQRDRAKRGVHAVNYGITTKALAISLGILVKEADHFMRMWFGAHPQIKIWQDSILNNLHSTRTISNAFGYRNYYPGEITRKLLGEALAWIPQSTVALVTNKGLKNVDRNLPHVDNLIQVHDSLVMQTPLSNVPHVFKEVQAQMEITIPYDDPLVIPVDVAASDSSWGDVKKVLAA